MKAAAIYTKKHNACICLLRIPLMIRVLLTIITIVESGWHFISCLQICGTC
jgi:hypothetical protein